MSTKQDLQLEQLGIRDNTDGVVDLEGISSTLMRGIPLSGFQVYKEEDLCYCKKSILDGTSAFNEVCSECSGFEEDCWYSPSRYTK